MKWIGGVILLIVTIILSIMSMFMFPWFETKAEYYREIITDSNPEYWDEKMGGVERDWDKSTYYLQEYELKSSTSLDWTRNNLSSSTSSGKISYNSPVESGGWEGSYRTMVEADYPVPGFLAGGNEQLNVYNYTYYFILIALIMSIIGIIFIVIAGLGKITPNVAKIFVAITIVFIVIAALYFALALPLAIETDDTELYKIKDPLKESGHEAPPEGGGAIMGEANERSEEGGTLSHINWAPGIGWWLIVGAIITSMLTLLFMPGKEAPVQTGTPAHLRRKYHEFDRPSRDYDDYDQEYIPPQQRGRGYDQYGDDYYDQPPRGRQRRPYDSRSMYQDDYGRGRAPGPQRQRRPGQPPPSYEGYDHGRPPPRPPQRRRRPPTGY